MTYKVVLHPSEEGFAVSCPGLPGIPDLRAVAALEKAGFRVLRQGRPIVMSDGRRIVTPSTLRRLPGGTRMPQAYHDAWKGRIRLAAAIARRAGLPHEDAQDCAAEFAEHCLERQTGACLPETPAACPPPRRARCAANFVRNRLRALRRRDAREQRARDLLAQASALRAPPGPVEALERRWGAERMARVLARVGPTAARAFLQHYLLGLSASDIAARTGRSPHAVEQWLHRTRERLRVLLADEGPEESGGAGPDAVWEALTRRP